MDVILRRWPAPLPFVAALIAQSSAAQTTELREWHIRGPRQTVGGLIRVEGFLRLMQHDKADGDYHLSSVRPSTTAPVRPM
jgi:hypothetical protein